MQSGKHRSRATCGAGASIAFAWLLCISGCREQAQPPKPAAKWQLRFFAAAQDPLTAPAVLASGTLDLPLVRTKGDEWQSVWKPTGEVSGQLRILLVEPPDGGYPCVVSFRDQAVFLQFNPGVVDANVEVTIATKGQEEEQGEWFWTSEAGPSRMGTVTLAKQTP